MPRRDQCFRRGSRRRGDGPGGLEIGYWIHPAFTRRGFATEVSDSLTDVGFTVDHIERVEIRHDRTNVASGGVPPRLGYEFVEERARPIEAPAETGIDCVWAMTKDRWTHQRALRTAAVEH